GSSLDDNISVLAQNLEARLRGDADHEFLLSDLEAIRANRERDTVSLNLETRKVEREAFRQARLDRENARRDAAGLEPLDSMEALEEAELPDIVLNEAADVVADMVSLQRTEMARNDR
ncbi:MAG: carboxy terminal-processing peptidase, partial [Pseudomonadota bacterium]